MDRARGLLRRSLCARSRTGPRAAPSAAWRLWRTHLRRLLRLERLHVRHDVDAEDARRIARGLGYLKVVLNMRHVIVLRVDRGNEAFD